MTNADDIREFLARRRARVAPGQAGLPAYGRNRRVPGVPGEEIALVTRIRVEYYTRLERGDARGVSDDVLESVSSPLDV